MKTLYLECAMGASGDMLMGALASLLDAPEKFIAEMNALGIPSAEIRMEPSQVRRHRETHLRNHSRRGRREPGRARPRAFPPART